MHLVRCNCCLMGQNCQNFHDCTNLYTNSSCSKITSCKSSIKASIDCFFSSSNRSKTMLSISVPVFKRFRTVKPECAEEVDSSIKNQKCSSSELLASFFQSSCHPHFSTCKQLLSSRILHFGLGNRL